MAEATNLLEYIEVIVYKCNATWNIQKRFRRYVKMRTSDKNKRWYAFLKKIRGHKYWWEEVK